MAQVQICLKVFFGNDFFGDDDDFFGFNNKMNQTQRFDDYPSYNYPPQQKPQSKNVININTNDNNNIKETKDNLSRSMNPNLYSKNFLKYKFKILKKE